MEVFKGRVQAVKGSSAVVEKDSLAANEPETDERNARIRVALTPSALNIDFRQFLPGGTNGAGALLETQHPSDAVV